MPQSLWIVREGAAEGRCLVTYLSGRYPRTALIDNQFAHQVSPVGRSTLENIFPRPGRVFLELDLPPIGKPCSLLLSKSAHQLGL